MTKKFNNMNTKYIFLLILSSFLIASCEDVIDIKLADSDNQLVVDAWINNKPENQTIRLRRTSAYFDSTPSPGEVGATVVVIDEDGQVFPFVDQNNGDYIWSAVGSSFGEIGKTYTLAIETADGQEYGSQSKMNRVIPIDSIVFHLRDEDKGPSEGFRAELFATDFEGPGDAYWIKTFKNGLFLNKPQEMNFAFDAGFTSGAAIDGTTFIHPIRQTVNRWPDEGDGATDTIDKAPWSIGDSIRIEIHSLTPESFFFMQQAVIQMTLGDASIFASPPTNVPTNIISINPKEKKDHALGFFNVAAVSSMGMRVE